MRSLPEIYKAIADEGFSARVLKLINDFTNAITDGRTNFSRYTIPEHAGVCTAGEVLIGATVVASYARTSLEASADAARGQEVRPSNWKIDQLQEQLIEQWAKAAHLWIDNSEDILTRAYGPKIAQGAEALVFYRSGDTSVVKMRASIYSTTLKALEAIALHNYLFPETAMHLTGFSRDRDHLLRIILTQPYVRCQRLATKPEIDAMVSPKGFHDNGDGNGTNYISDRITLEDMHPANVFIDDTTGKPICIDCIVKFRN